MCDDVHLVAITGGNGPIFVDFIKDGQTLLTRTIDVRLGAGAVSVDLPPELFGTVQLCAYRFKDDHILAQRTRAPAELERENPNYIGGDIAGGSHTGLQLFARPRLFHPYETPDEGLFLCSASTPPGAGVHGMCGYHAARAVLRRWRSASGRS